MRLNLILLAYGLEKISDERERKFPMNSIGGGADMETDGGSFLLDFH